MSTSALPIAETTNQLKSELIKSHIGFRGEGKTGVPGEKKISEQSIDREGKYSLIWAIKVCAAPKGMVLWPFWSEIKASILTGAHDRERITPILSLSSGSVAL